MTSETPIDPVVETAPTEPLGRVEHAAMGTSLDAYRQAKTLEATNPTPVPDPAVTAAPLENRKTRQDKEQERINAAIRRAVDDATAPLKSEIARLQPRPESARPPVSAPATAAAPTLKDHQRYLAMPDAPKETEFTDYKDYTAAVSIFVHDQRAAEREHARTRDTQARTQQERDFARFDKVHAAFSSDPSLQDVFEVIRATNQVPSNSPISVEVLSLKPFAMLAPNEPPSALNAIAEELLNSDHPVALAKALSKPGELARLKALPDARSLIREIGRLEDAAQARAPVLETQAGTPATTLTSARATDPLDPVESALRRGDMTAYKKARTAERLRAAGLK